MSEEEGEKVDEDDEDVTAVKPADSGTGKETNGDVAGSEHAAIEALTLPVEDEEVDESVAAEQLVAVAVESAVCTPGL